LARTVSALFFLSTEFVDKKNANARLMAFRAMRTGLRNF